VFAAIRDEVRRIHPRLLVDIRTMREEIARDIATERMVAGTSAFFGLLAGIVSVALVGNYSKISFLWYNVVGCGVVVAVGMFLSLVDSGRASTRTGRTGGGTRRTGRP